VKKIEWKYTAIRIGFSFYYWAWNREELQYPEDAGWKPITRKKGIGYGVCYGSDEIVNHQS